MFRFKTVDPDQMVHPLRHELDDDDVRAILCRVYEDDESLTMDELDCAQDWLFDFIAAEKQTVPGTTVLQ